MQIRRTDNKIKNRQFLSIEIRDNDVDGKATNSV